MQRERGGGGRTTSTESRRTIKRNRCKVQCNDKNDGMENGSEDKMEAKE